VGPFFFLAIAFAAVGSRLGAVMLWALAALALLAAGWASHSNRKSFSILSVFVAMYASWVSLSTLVLSPAYTPAGLYHPILLLVAFFVTRQMTQHAQRDAATWALVLVAGLAAWGLHDVFPGGAARAQALFETPATFAAIVNVALVPLLAAALAGVRGTAMTAAIIVVLAAAGFSGESRGGLLALAAGIGFAAMLAMRGKLLRVQSVGIALTVLIMGWGIATALRTLPVPVAEAPPSAVERAASSQSRLELYALSWDAWQEHPITGTGYLTYRYVLEQGRARVPSYGKSNETWFTHNDYLQTLQELGPLGLIAFLGLTILPMVLAYRRIPDLPPEQRPVVVSVAAALAAMSAHALVDFPFYIPACLLLYGAMLGVLDARLRVPTMAPSLARRRTPWQRAAHAGVVAVIAIIFLRPLAAEAAAEWGLRKSATGHAQNAAFWLGAAQRIEPKDWRYHWYVGRFWDAQATQSARPEAANLAAEAYAAGFEANPLVVENLLGKIAVHRHHRLLLEEPADNETLRRWLAQANLLAPVDADVQRENAR
jgi:O-antigen ligase